MVPLEHGIARILALTAVVTISTQHKPGLSTSHHSVREEFTRLPMPCAAQADNGS